MSSTLEIIILGTKKDEHVSAVSSQLDRLGCNHIIVDYLESTSVRFCVDQNGNYKLEMGGELCPSPLLIWDRRKLWTPGLMKQGDHRSIHYETQEWNAFYSLLTGLFSNAVVNSHRSRRCLIKPYQQIVAANAGFKVPPTMVTNSKRDCVTFLSEQSELVVKSLSAGKVIPKPEENPIPYNVMTMSVSADVLNTATEREIQLCPHFFQRNVAKMYELRVFVVASSMFAFQINSQDSSLTRQDWRNGIQSLQFIPTDLEKDISKKIRRFMKHMDLFTASFDLIVDPQNVCWFLECNQDGQWAWLDQIVDGAIASSFAQALAIESSKVSENLEQKSQ